MSRAVRAGARAVRLRSSDSVRTAPLERERLGRTVEGERRGVERPTPEHRFGRVRVHETLAPVMQPKLKMGTPGDKYEREADRVANHVMQLPDGRVPNQSSPTTAPQQAGLVQSSLGEPLSPATREFMEARLGRSFSDVRVHTDVQAAASAEAIGARSYTVGRDIVFSQREYVPETVQGRRLLAHELAHVCQQTRAGECGPFTFSNAGAAVVQCKFDEESVTTTLSLDVIHEAIVEGWITKQERLIEKVRELNGDDRQALVLRLQSHHRQLMASANMDFVRDSGDQADLEKKIFRIERAVHAIALEFEPELAKSVTTSPVLDSRKARRAERKRREAERKEQEFAEIERELNRLLAEREGPPPIHPPPHIERRNRQLLPVAQAIEFLYAFLPHTGPVLDAYYAISGETLLGEKLSTPARVLSGVCAAIPFAGALIRAGKTGAHAILQIARRTNSDPRKVLQTIKRLDALSEEKVIIEEALAIVEQGGELSQKHKEALAKLVEAVEGRRPPLSRGTAALKKQGRVEQPDAGAQSVTIQTPGVAQPRASKGRFARVTSDVPTEAKGSTARDAGETIGEGAKRHSVSRHTGRGVPAEAPRAEALGYTRFRAGFKIFDGAKRVGEKLRLWSLKTVDPVAKDAVQIVSDVKKKLDAELLTPLNSDLVRRLRNEFNTTSTREIKDLDFQMPRELVDNPLIEIHVDIGWVGSRTPQVAAAEVELLKWFDEAFPGKADLTFFYDVVPVRQP
jgi:hypothetical protein